QEMSNIEAAATLQISVDALESLLARGRRSLQAILAEDGADE
ncbi:RNA polymerase sigma-70 factor, partial [Mesorhizobium sp. M7A.F.Ca.US.001.04.1.1]